MKKEDFYDTKWDTREWTEEQKIQWQEKCFELGFSWQGKVKIHGLDAEYYWLDRNNFIYLSTNDYEYFLTESSEEKHYEDMFPEQSEEKLDVIAEIVKLVHEAQGVEEEEEEEDSFEGLVYVAPEEEQDWMKYFSLGRKSCSEAQWDYILENCPLSAGTKGSEDYLQICNDGDGWFDNDESDSDDIVVTFNDIFQYKKEA